MAAHIVSSRRCVVAMVALEPSFHMFLTLVSTQLAAVGRFETALVAIVHLPLVFLGSVLVQMVLTICREGTHNTE